MKKDDRNNLKRERFIMISTSALVLTALTVTGVSMRNHTRRSQDNGYTIDFSALENSADDKLKEIVGNSGHNRQNSSMVEEVPDLQLGVGSDEVTIPGLTGDKGKTTDAKSGEKTKDPKEGKNDQVTTQQAKDDATGKTGVKADTKTADKSDTKKGNTTKSDSGKSADFSNSDSMSDGVEQAVLNHEEVIPYVEVSGAGQALVEEELHFLAAAMQKPVNGTPLIDYSMDKSVYFATLDQYKYNPAVIYGAQQGEAVHACTTGRVINVHDDAELGRVLIMDLGDGYQAIYGQLENIEIPIGATVEAGTKLATVAAPTKYFAKEGSNLYFQLKKDGACMNPGDYF